MANEPLGRAGPGNPGTLSQVAERIATADKVLLTCHRGPDGDSVGSMTALAAILRSRGKKAILYNPDQVPRKLKWMPLARSFVRRLPKDARFPVTVVVDCADARMLGKNFPGPEITGELIALDHHSSSRPFGDLYICDPAAASVGVLVARIVKSLGWTIPNDAAVGIYVSLVSDTGSFSYSNTSAEALHLAAELVDCGVKPGHIYSMLHERSSLQRYKLLVKALDSIELRLDDKIAFMTITHEMVKQAGANWDDTHELINYSRALAGVECGVLFTPAKYGGVRVSMRSKGEIDCGALCEVMGGGGHIGAAGCVIDGDMAAARAWVERSLAEALGVEVPEPDPEPSADPGESAEQGDSDNASASPRRGQDSGNGADHGTASGSQVRPSVTVAPDSDAGPATKPHDAAK